MIRLAAITLPADNIFGDTGGSRLCKFARTPIIIEPIRYVIILLDFHQRHASADRVHRSCRDIIEAAGVDGLPFHQRFDAAIQSRDAQFFGCQVLTQPDAEPRIRGRIQHIPAFRLAAREPILPSLFVIGMDLDREFFARENIFDQKGQVDPLYRQEPDLSNAATVTGGYMGWDVRPSPRLFDSLGNKAMYRHMPLIQFR